MLCGVKSPSLLSHMQRTMEIGRDIKAGYVEVDI